ncbi:MAG: hypothetical protein GY937_25265 [bacterium]|nr:hypothetical protein [bacterium]
MTERQKVWTLESGSYSDYTVHGVYSTKAKAELVASALTGNWSVFDIVEQDMDPLVEELEAGMHLYDVLMDSKGHVERVSIDAEPATYTAQDGCTWWKRSTAPAYRGKGVLDAVRGHIWAADEGHAIKIANEYRVRHLAKGASRD